MEPDVYITTRDAAQLAGVSERTIRRWVKNGRLPATQAPDANGRTVYQFLPADVTQAASQDAIPTTAARQPEQTLAPAESPAGVDLVPLLTRMEELIRENERLRTEIAALQPAMTDPHMPLPTPATSDDPWYRRWLRWFTGPSRESTSDDSYPSADRETGH